MIDLKFIPSNEVLEDRLQMCFSLFDCCKSNLERYENGSAQHKRWLQHSLNAMKQIFELEDLSKNLNEIEKKIAADCEKAA